MIHSATSGLAPRAALAVLVALGLTGLGATAASASVTLRVTDGGFSTASSIDIGYEFTGGLLDLAYPGLVPTAAGNVLVPLERAVGQLRAGSSDRRGLHLPNAATGQPVADGGTGVTQALTNSGAFAANTTDFVSGVGTSFTLARTGNTVNFTTSLPNGSSMLTSLSRQSIANINAFQFRLRTNAVTPMIGANAILLSNLKFTDTSVTDQLLANISAADGFVEIRLFDGIAPGDFALSGISTWNWTPNLRPGNSAQAVQIKLLQVPVLTAPGIVPEPASWALLIAGFGLTGATMRRRRAQRA